MTFLTNRCTRTTCTSQPHLSLDPLHFERALFDAPLPLCNPPPSPHALDQDLKRAKKQKMKEIIEAMETFNSNLQNSRRLVKKLERDRCDSIPPRFGFDYLSSLLAVVNERPCLSPHTLLSVWSLPIAQCTRNIRNTARSAWQRTLVLAPFSFPFQPCFSKRQM